MTLSDHLIHLLEWASLTRLTDSRKLDPFPAYLVTKKISPSSLVRGLRNARHFFLWARTEYPHLYKPVTESWIESLQPPRDHRPQSRLPERSYYTLDDVLTICRQPVDFLILQRAQTAVAMLYLSGMRAEALATLPIHCVDLPNRTIQQLPEFGVRTKNRKAAITYLLPIPELLTIVERWDALLKSQSLKADNLWYAPIDNMTDSLVATATAFKERHDTIRRDILKLCTHLGVNYLSPHKLRHGHVVYGVSKVKTMRELKSVSLNVMHSSVVTTDSIYSRLVGDEVKSVISSLA